MTITSLYYTNLALSITETNQAALHKTKHGQQVGTGRKVGARMKLSETSLLLCETPRVSDCELLLKKNKR